MSFEIGGRRLGPDQPCFVIAEAGSNHNGRLDLALRLIDEGASAGADAVKFQLFRASRLYPRSAGRSDYLGDPRPIYDIIAAMELPEDWLEPLAARCRERGVLFLASAFDESSADRVDPFVAAHKIASYEMTHLPLVRHVARFGKPMIVSTGTADLDEVIRTVEAIRAEGNDRIVLLQCTASYPAPPEALNLRAIPTLASATGCLAGLSDHSRDPLVAPVAAVALGAAVIEKHFTLGNAMDGPDHAFAVEIPELQRMVQAVRLASAALGHGRKETLPAERELRAFARRSVFATRAIRRDEAFTPGNVAVLRCGKLPAGLPPAAWDDVLRRRAARDVAAETALRPEDLA